MDAALAQAKKQNQDMVRLVQSPSHIRSFVLYTKCGFILREPLFLMQGAPLGDVGDIKRVDMNGILLRPIENDKDISVCNELCRSVHGFTREMELRRAKDQGAALILENNENISGYAAGIGLFGHAVAKSNEDLKRLIAGAPAIQNPGFFVPARNQDILNWLLENGFKIRWPANLMTKGPYQEPRMPFLPSLAY